MLDETWFWFLIVVVAFVGLGVVWEEWSARRAKRRLAARREAERARRATVRERSGRVNASLSVEERTAHVQIPGLTAPARKRLLEKYGGGCAYCDSSLTGGVNLHWDHVLPLTLGGANHVSNVVPACSSCNLRKGSKHPARWFAEIGRALDFDGVVVGSGAYQGSAADRARDAEFIRLVSGDGRRSDKARRLLDGIEVTDGVRAALLDGARDALDHLAEEWRGRYRGATRYRNAVTSYPDSAEPVAVAYKRVRELERRTSARERTVAEASRGRIAVKRIPADEFRDQEQWRQAVTKMNIWGVRPR